MHMLCTKCTARAKSVGRRIDGKPEVREDAPERLVFAPELRMRLAHPALALVLAPLVGAPLAFAPASAQIAAPATATQRWLVTFEARSFTAPASWP